MKANIIYTGIRGEDLEESAEFYTKLLGMKESGLVLVLVQEERLARYSPRIFFWPLRRTSTRVEVLISADDASPSR